MAPRGGRSISPSLGFHLLNGGKVYFFHFIFVEHAAAERVVPDFPGKDSGSDRRSSAARSPRSVGGASAGNGKTEIF